jgi:hypothetical protein
MQKAQNRLMRFDLEPPSAPPPWQRRRRSRWQIEWKIKKSAAGADLVAVFYVRSVMPLKTSENALYDVRTLYA